MELGHHKSQLQSDTESRIEIYNNKFLLGQWEFLKSKYEAGQLAHAYVFLGPEELKKEVFAKEFVKLLHCLSGNSSQVCQNCRMIERGFFPDLLVVKSANSESSLKNEKDMMEIDVSQIKEVQQFLSYKSYYGGYKSVIIENAERMNLEAQNSFLKNLEEPKGKTLIILVSSKPDILLPTIASRCQTIKFLGGENGVYTGLSKDLLAVIHADLAEKFKYAKAVNLEGNNFNSILLSLRTYFRNLLLMKIGVVNTNPNNGSKEASYSVKKLQKIIRMIENISHQVFISNASPKLALEILLMEM